MKAFSIKHMTGVTSDPHFVNKLEKWLLENTQNVRYQYHEEIIEEEDE